MNSQKFRYLEFYGVSEIFEAKKVISYDRNFKHKNILLGYHKNNKPFNEKCSPIKIWSFVDFSLFCINEEG